MKILYIAHRIPYPPNKGDKIRSFHQIRHLSKKHKVHLACLVDDKNDLQYIKCLEEYCVSVDAVFISRVDAKFKAVLALFTSRSLSVASFYSRELHKRIHQRIESENFDLLIGFSSPMAQYVMDIKKVPKIMDFVDVDSEKWKQYADLYPFPLSFIFRLEGNRLAQFEEEVARSFNYSVFVSENEALLFKQRIKDRPSASIRNGVDLDYYHPSYHCNESAFRDFNHFNIVFVGMMDYPPNVDAVKFFVDEIFPLVREVIPKAEFYIVGRNPTRQVSELKDQVNVHVTGSVEDVRPYLCSAKVSVAPFRIARGTQNKILEALAMGIPVVATSNAYQGMGSDCREGILIADVPAIFAGHVIDVLNKDELFHALSKKGRKNMEEVCHWDHTLLELDKIMAVVQKEKH